IIIETGDDQNEIKPNEKTTVTLFDVNRQKVEELDLTTNEYGTFSGSFTLPSTGLTGMMQIRNESGNTSFSVEEYKRPRFEVTFQPVKGSFRLNDEVSVSGEAEAYAGANIDNAEVQF
ncbi:hypothetical protein GWO43_28070, partial [candidate division KSB1 bacterium]|nr:hypothetical protein [candidate division KSB1 bacterium]NIS27793.1 hypothetical protein [candidate division KSB1 bacterium]NIT74647.1 hypothetical protein [candidate division KSB1 bacterium]NIU28460.1 hypothetical protein [candidate division KSB1 bacterium]NIU91721.1 hypothetical protein [candidate division KSB1 bacterium]